MVLDPPDDAEFVFAGYDYGYVQGAWNNFSAVYNDVIYGRYNALRPFGAHLKDRLLLPKADLALEFARERQQLVQAGADLETDEALLSIAVYLWRGNTA